MHVFDWIGGGDREGGEKKWGTDGVVKKVKKECIKEGKWDSFEESRKSNKVVKEGK